jgi:archaetidylinositol phosphate synthase
MITHKIRGVVQPYLSNSIGKGIAKLGISPNIVSLLALVLAPFACYFIVLRLYLLAALFVILSGVVDLIDGCVARAMNRTTKFGAYLDGILDRYVDCILYLGFVLDGFVLETFLATCGTLLTSYAKPRTAIGVKMYTQDWPTIGERTERFILIIAGLIVASFFPTLLGISTIRLMLWLITVMTHIGAVQRIVYTYRLVREPENEKTRKREDEITRRRENEKTGKREDEKTRKREDEKTRR